MHRTYEPIKMFAPETLLKQKKLHPPSMSDAEIAEAICQLTADVHVYASSEYYLQIIGAIRILAQALTVGEEPGKKAGSPIDWD